MVLSARWTKDFAQHTSSLAITAKNNFREESGGAMPMQVFEAFITTVKNRALWKKIEI